MTHPRKWRSGLVVPLGVTSLVLGMTAPGNAEPGQIEEQEPSAEATDRADVSLSTAKIHDVNEVIDIFIQMDEPAVAEYVAESKRMRRPEPSPAQQRAQSARVKAQHDKIRPALKQLDVEVQSALDVAANGLRVKAKIADIPELAELDGVRSVAPVALHEPANDTSVPWIGSPEAWQELGVTGEGIIISVIDTGIDYTHASFGGSGDPADYESLAQDPTVIPEVDGEPAFPTPKVAAGYDFAGVDYDASVDGSVPEPDPNPLDGHGHGTHVAASAAGVEVLDESGDVAVGSGVAPGATLYAAKVFGDIAGSTAVTADAINWSLDPNGDGSMDDRAHVINMSLGADFGQQGDPSVIASNNAAAAGTVVVSSAGNAGGGSSYAAGTPGSADGVIGVAASADDGHFVLGLEVHEPASVAGQYEAAESGTSLPLSEHGPLTDEQLVAADPLIACDGDGIASIGNPQELEGKIALVQRGTCAFTIKHQAVQDAGATGIVVFNNGPGDPIVMGGDPAGITIPGVMISQNDGAALLGALDDGETVSLTMSEDIVIPKPELADTLADFTSRGPGNTSNFKPDVAAPGFGIRSAAAGTGDQARSSSGTSMASPHVAGLAALLAYQHGLPDIEDVEEAAATVQKIKSLIMNSTVDTAESYPLTLQGTGVVRADRAVELDAYTLPAGLSFGRLNPVEPTTLTETVEVHNLADVAQTFDVGFTPNEIVPGVQLSHDDSVTVPAGGSATIDVTLTLDPAAMPAEGLGFSQTEFDGWVNLSDDDTSLRAGVLAVVDPASAVDFEAVDKEVGETSIDLDVVNDSLTTGVSSGYSFVRAGDDAGGVFEALGVRTFATGDPAIPVVEFGLATEGFESLSALETQILLDVDEDGVSDHTLVAADLNFLQGLTDPDGRTATALFNLSTGGGLLEYFVEGDYNDEVQGLIVDRFDDTGFLEAGNTDFGYQAVQFFGDELVGVQSGSIDLADDVDGRFNPDLAVPAGSGGTLPFSLEDERDMLWLHPGNQAGQQYEVVTLDRLCDETITGDRTGRLTVSDGTVCLADGSSVTGKVTVRDGAGFATDGAFVHGGVTADGASVVSLLDSEVLGTVTVRGSTGPIEIAGNIIDGSIRLRNNTTGDSPIVVGDNEVSGGIDCRGNEPAPTDDGDPNAVVGGTKGQCSGL